MTICRKKVLPPRAPCFQKLLLLGLRFASGGVPDDAPCHTCAQGDDSTPPAFLEAAGLVKSRGEAKRLIKEGALSVDGQRCDDAMSPLAAGEYVIKLGKKRFLRLTVTA